jgi:hypothetical protein
MVGGRWLQGFAAAAALSLLCSCGGDTAPRGSGAASAPRAGTPAVRGKPRGSVTVDLGSLQSETAEYQGQGRNLFAFGGGAATPTSPAVTAPPRRTVEAPATSRPAPAARVNLEFAGYVEKPKAGGGKVKYAIFLNGQEILTGTEGGVVANRYRVVEIGLESVTVSVEGSSATQRIPLKSK